MNAPNNQSVANRLRAWWLSPPRHGMARLIWPFEYRHLRLFGIVRIVGGVVAAVAGVICLGYSVYGWAAFFLAIAALDLAAGYWELTLAGPASART